MGMQWLNEPAHWSRTRHQITVKTSPKTDFWRVTHYDFIRDNGHFYFERVKTDFIVEVEIRGNYKDLYDQAGIMVRTNEHHWIKAGIEYVDGVQNLSAVVTHDYSDWSMTPLVTSSSSLRLRIEYRKNTIYISYAAENSKYVPFRLAHFSIDHEAQVGVMCASPEGAGYDVVFDNYHLISQPSD